MPEEQRPAINQLSDILFGNESSKEGKQSQIEMILNFHTNSLVKIEDIRFSSSEISRLLSTLSPETNDTEPKPETNTPPCLPGKRVSQLHQLIFDAMFYNPSASTLDLWDLIQQDSESDTPLYDQDGIIKIMDTACIEWRSRNGVNQSMLWGSFVTRVSTLKNKLPT